MDTDTNIDRTILDALDGAFPTPSAAELGALHGLLAERADASELLDVAYRTVDSPFGQLLVAVTPAGLVRLAFELEDHDAVLAALSHTVSPRMLRSGRRTDDVARQLGEYFAGERRSFDVPVDLQLVDGFRRTVIEQLPHIAYGTTESYADVAGAAGSPKAVRAVGVRARTTRCRSSFRVTG